MAFTRYNVVGCSGSGKSTFARRLASVRGLPLLEIDALFWGSNWTPRPQEAFQAALAAAVTGEAWVLDGNYAHVEALKWPRTQVLVWLDYSFSRVFCRALKRAVGRAVTGRELWPGTGNRESFWRTFFSRDSVLWWMVTQWRPSRERYEGILAEPKWAYLRVVRLRRPAEAERFLCGETGP